VPRAMSSCELTNAGALQRWPHRGGCPEAFAAQLPDGWGGSGKTLGDLDLMSIDGVYVLLVDRHFEWQRVYTINGSEQLSVEYVHKATDLRQEHRPTAGTARDPISMPMAATVLHEGDWIYFGINKEGRSADDAKDAVSERLGLTEPVREMGSLARNPSKKTFIQFLPEFFYFKFPAYCAGAVLGRPQDALPGQNALNMRQAFGVNVAGIVRGSTSEVSWWPGAGGRIELGDGALILRAPQWHGDDDRDDDDWAQALAASPGLADLLDFARFRARLRLDEDSEGESGDDAIGAFAAATRRLRRWHANVASAVPRQD